MNIPSGMLMHPDFRGRPVDARWQRIADLADRGEPATYKFDDAAVRRGLEYERRRRACRDRAGRELLARHDPDVDAAYALRHEADKLTRGEAEARLLAGRSVEEVASRCGLSLGAVTADAMLYFDVAGRLGAKHDVLIHAVGGSLWDGSLREGDCDVLLKWIATVKGPIRVDVLLKYFRRGLVVPDTLEGASAGQLEDLALLLEMKALVLTRTTPWPNCLRALRLCALAEQLRESIPSLTAPPSPVTAGPLYVGAAFTAGAGGAGGQAEADAAGWWAAWRSEVAAA